MTPYALFISPRIKRAPAKFRGMKHCNLKVFTVLHSCFSGHDAVDHLLHGSCVTLIKSMKHARFLKHDAFFKNVVASLLLHR